LIYLAGEFALSSTATYLTPDLSTPQRCDHWIGCTRCAMVVVTFEKLRDFHDP
jgi:hypothetical protein